MKACAMSSCTRRLQKERARERERREREGEEEGEGGLGGSWVVRSRVTSPLIGVISYKYSYPTYKPTYNSPRTSLRERERERERRRVNQGQACVSEMQ